MNNAISVGPAGRIGRVLAYGILIIACCFYLLPLIVMLVTSLKSIEEIRLGKLLAFPDTITFEAWQIAWSSACTGVTCDGLRGYFWNSVLITVPAVFISTALGALNGYVMTKWRFRGSELFFGMLLIGTMIPFQVVLLPMAQTLGILGLSGTISGLVLVHVVYGVAFTTLFFRNYYVSLPDELIKAAMIDGAGFFKIFWRIILPISIPIIVVSVIWQFTQIWNDFLFGVVYSSGDQQPLTVGLNNLVNTSTGIKQYNVDMAAAIIAAIPTLLVYVVAGKYFVRGLTAGAVKG
ncbi:MAG: glucose/mannose transport system permease protein [Polaribacter sp.]|jgi:glucose/mannose transport system permease protein